MFEKINKEVEGSKWVIIAFTITIAILVSLLLLTKVLTEVKSYQFIGSGVVAQDTISVSGIGEVFAIADIAQVSFSITEKDSTVAKAQQISSEKINKIISFLKNNGIKEKDIKTINYNVYPKYEYSNNKEVVCLSVFCPNPRQKQVLVGYEVSQTISVKIREIDKAGKILAGIGGLSVTNISGLNFQVDDEEIIKREARQKAIVDAKDKARAISKDLGIKLIRIVNFSESGNYPVYRSFGVEALTKDGVSRGSVPKIPVGENKITSRVTITYEIK